MNRQSKATAFFLTAFFLTAFAESTGLALVCVAIGIVFSLSMAYHYSR